MENPRRDNRAEDCAPRVPHPLHWRASQQTSQRRKCEFQLLFPQFLPIWLHRAVKGTKRTQDTPPPQPQTPDISKAKSECELSLWVETQKSSSSLLFSFTFSGSFFCNDFSLLMVPMKFCFQIQNISFNSILNAICRIQRFSYGFLLVYLGTACAVFRLLTITLRRSVI